MRKRIYLSGSKDIYAKVKLPTVVAICGLILIGLFSKAYGEEVQGTLVRRTAGRDFGLPYTELKICPAAQSAARCVSVYTGPNGRFSVRLDPGRYNVAVTYQAGRETYAGQIDVVRGAAIYPKIVIKP